MASLPDLPMTEDQRALCDMARRALREHYPPAALVGLDATRTRGDAGAWSTLAKLGWTALSVPEARGGMGCDAATVAMLMTEIGYGLLAVPLAACGVLCGAVLGRAEDVDGVRALTDALVGGDQRFAMALLEEETGYHIDRPASRGRSERGMWRVSGSKCAVVGAPDADVLLVSAAIDGEAAADPPVALFAVARDAPGVTIEPSVGIDSVPCGDVTLNGAPVLAGGPLAAAPRAAEIIGDGVALATAAVCWEAIGIMRLLIDTTIDHLRDREQFGRRLADFQVLQHRIADMYLEYQRAESLGVMALREGFSGDRPQRERSLSAAKARIGQAARFVAQQAVQLHGGMGVSNEHVVAHGLRRLVAIDATFGNGAYHLERYRVLSEI